MKKDRVSVAILPDIRRVKEEGKFPLKLKITYKGERKYYGTGFDATDQEWEAITQGNVRGDLRRIKLGVLGVKLAWRMLTKVFLKNSKNGPWRKGCL